MVNDRVAQPSGHPIVVLIIPRDTPQLTSAGRQIRGTSEPPCLGQQEDRLKAGPGVDHVTQKHYRAAIVVPVRWKLWSKLEVPRCPLQRGVSWSAQRHKIRQRRAPALHLAPDLGPGDDGRS